MPSVDHLSGDRLAYRALEVLEGDGREYVDRALLWNMARIVDRAVLRYREARQSLDEWIATRSQGGESSRYRGVSAVEECVTLTHRAISFGYAGVERGIVDLDLLPPADVRAEIKEMRDAIHHVDDRLLGKRRELIAIRDYFFPTFGDTEIVLGIHRLEYGALAAAIIALHRALEAPPHRPHAH